MLKHNLPQLISHAIGAGRHILGSLCLSGKAFRASLWEKAPAAAKARKDKGKRAGFEKPLLIHYHIFKNAGTSFEWALRHGLGSGVHRLDMPRHDGFVSHNEIIRYVEEHANVKVLSSHQASPPAPRIEGRRVLTSILIRDPIARIRSIYEFERIQPSDAPGPVKAKAVDFRTYVEWRLTATPRMLCNFQVHFFRRDGSRTDSPVSLTDLKNANKALDAIDIVGTVERYGEWLALARGVLSDSFGDLKLIPVRRNQAAGPAIRFSAEILEDLVRSLGPDLAHRLIEQNALDTRLHQVADELLTRRLAGRSGLIKSRQT